MQSPVVKYILAEYSRKPSPILELPHGLSKNDFADLAHAAGVFSTVNELRLRSSDADWIFGGLTTFALRLKALSSLDLGGSDDISDIGLRAITNHLPALTTLRLTNCARVTDAGVMAIASNLPAITELDLQGCNQLTDAAFIATADKFPVLRQLYLWRCDQLTDAAFVAIASKRPALIQLFLGGCNRVTDVGITAITDGLRTLTHLDLGNCNQLTDAGVLAVADRLPALTHLALTYCNQLTDASISAIADSLPALTYLDLTDCNRVTNLGVTAVFDRLTALTHLYLWGCKRVTILPDSIGRLHKLEGLYLDGTRLTQLPIALRRLRRLRNLDVHNVPALKLPEELTLNAEKPWAILDYYFRTTTEGKRTLNEAKLILVGNEAVGKTSLVNFLVHKRPCKDTSKTVGVEIVEGVDVKSWDVDKDAAGDTPLKLNMWDFGGQQVLYETHQFFLTARSLYLIVLEARRENANEQEANLHTWLRSIRTRTVQSVPVIVVINKSEAPHDLRLDEARLLHEFPNIRGFIRTSCRDPKKHKEGGRGIGELRKAIVDVIRADLPHIRDQIPVSYFIIMEQLAKTARRSFILNTKDYRKKCAAQNVTETREQNDLLTLLDCIGMVVKYDDTTLLDPNWLTTAVYQVLTHQAVVESEGQFARSDLGKLLAELSAKDYPPERWPFIAEMMKRFGLSFELPGQPDHYLLPNQLPVNDPQPPWDEKDSLRFRYEYRHTPPRGLFPRLIVQAHRHLTSPRVAWLSGVQLEIQSCPVLVRMNRQERRANISVRGPKNKRRDALSVIREYFGSVHALNRFEPNTDFTSQVPVDVPGKPDAAFDFEELETYERNGVDTILYKGCDLKFSVKELLAGVGPEPMQHNRSANRVYNDNRVTNVNNSGTMTATAINDSDVLAGKVDVSIDPHWRHQTDQ
ncbi:hypothetical protein J8F10_02510 [Gemmata sp. G18]|uniref:non-specific serine/threonine protein kinase n=1 Tax=Gemmata palustris TaxID=2822762 RepID=A0ABS5BKE0_9BACT|nr:COR domain-containing protein [Gemmata palustris]MBP3954169.1 hypothetical protein [Gemmata palustris]